MLGNLKSIVKQFLAWKNRRARRSNALKKQDVIKELASLDIVKGDNLFIHSRLSTVGYFDESPDWIIDYFIERIGPAGNLSMPTFSSNGYASEYLEKNKYFDLKNTPSRMGILTQLFLKREGVYRSIHPTHSVACYGALGQELTNEHHLDTVPFGRKSPFYKFLQLPNAKVLSLGLTMFPMTVFRVYESLNLDIYPFPIFFDRLFEFKFYTNGTEEIFYTLAHNPTYSNLRRNMLFENRLLESSKLKPYPIGNSKSYLLDCDGFLEFMDENFNGGNLPYLGYYKDFDKDNVEESRLQKTWESR